MNNNEHSNNFTTLSPKLDVVFQALFGEVGSEKFTSRFLESILQERINSIDLSQNPILRREYLNDKMGILDILAKLNESEYCNIEMQVADQASIIERILYYWGKVNTRQLKTGKTYNNLQKTIVILITDFLVSGLEKLEYHTSWKIIEEKYRKTILTEKLEIRILELPKIANLSNENDELLDWLFFLDNPNSERVIKKMQKNNELKQASQKLDEISQDEHMRRIAEWRQKAIISENTNISASFKKGSEQTREEIAIELLKENMSIEFVQKITRLSVIKIEKLKKQIQDFVSNANSKKI